MNHLVRNKRKVYLCNQTISLETNRIIYTEPTEYNLYYQPLTTDGEIIAAGQEYINRLVIYTSPKIAKEFHDKDRCYVFTEVPETYDKTCTNADFYVDGEPLFFLNEARIYLQRMTGDDVYAKEIPHESV